MELTQYTRHYYEIENSTLEFVDPRVLAMVRVRPHFVM